ncbi:MAG: hypothetical protein ACHQIM_15320 [Sphingobacteriales bacterium]
MAWTDTSDTCVAVFGSLTRLNQIDGHTTFAVAGTMQMKDLAFYNPLATVAVNNANALAQARLIDQMMINGFVATYKPVFNSVTAIAALAAVMQVGTNTVEKLSDTADTIYSC